MCCQITTRQIAENPATGLGGGMMRRPEQARKLTPDISRTINCERAAESIA
jgi:hypothetical protein